MSGRHFDSWQARERAADRRFFAVVILLATCVGIVAAIASFWP